MQSLGICIATHERATLLQTALQALSKQTRLPDEIIISDSSRDEAASHVVASFAAAHPQLCVIYVKSQEPALPWHRWWGFVHSRAEIILFLDDDMQLAPTALQSLANAYRQKRESGALVAGIGFVISFEDERPGSGGASSWKERWLGISGVPSRPCSHWWMDHKSGSHTRRCADFGG